MSKINQAPRLTVTYNQQQIEQPFQLKFITTLSAGVFIFSLGSGLAAMGLGYDLPSVCLISLVTTSSAIGLTYSLAKAIL